MTGEQSAAVVATWLGVPALDPAELRRSELPSVGAAELAARLAPDVKVYYRDSDGVEPVDDFIEGLGPKPAAKIDSFVEEHLNGRPPGAPRPEFPISSQIEGELRELRVRFARTRYRVLYQRSGNLYVLLHAFEKHTGAVARGDKELAKRRMADFRKRMDAEPRRPPRAAGGDAPGGRDRP
ncbi:MAG TPA: type II toxin-antitoxin system RelE/ParE family toxin [Solirubrobacterales bacterium]|nr:type II toxin-antitoxin system RelE/ParE family toxin [Solirubrobacterales bacterium]